MMICKNCLLPVGKFDSQVFGIAAKGGPYCIHGDCLMILDASTSKGDSLPVRLLRHLPALTRS
jgi:hypothetical protein